MNESDTEFASDKPINDRHDILVPEAKVHVTSELAEPQQKDCEVLRKKRKCYDIKLSSRKILSVAQRLCCTGSWST